MLLFIEGGESNGTPAGCGKPSAHRNRRSPASFGVARPLRRLPSSNAPVGHREFIRCSLADIVRGLVPVRRDAQSIAVFSPVGLGILDLAVGHLVYELALREDRGISSTRFW